jgi:hypothetical protein
MAMEQGTGSREEGSHIIDSVTQWILGRVLCDTLVNERASTQSFT